jgi:sterol desaturase/sphingolipid hydroxylase (fatty acid hydroxylase superfamily)
MDTISWILFYLILPLVLGVLGNFISPVVQTLFQKNSLTRKERRIKALISKYKRVNKFRDNNQLLVFQLSRIIMIIVLTSPVIIIYLFGISIALIFPLLINFIPQNIVNDSIVTIIIIGIYWVMFIALFAYYIFKALLHFIIVKNVFRFEKYKEETIKQLIKLGGIPEDLDKEESEE